MEFGTIYIILYSKSHIVWGHFYFVSPLNSWIPNGSLWAHVISKFWDRLPGAYVILELVTHSLCGCGHVGEFNPSQRPLYLLRVSLITLFTLLGTFPSRKNSGPFGNLGDYWPSWFQTKIVPRLLLGSC